MKSNHKSSKNEFVRTIRNKNIVLLFVFFVLFRFSLIPAFAQKKFEKEKNIILTEGLALYTLILANWTSNDLYYENEFNTSIVKGYLSYKEKDTVFTIFWREMDTTSAEYKARTFKQVGDTGIYAQQIQKFTDLRIIIKTIAYPQMKVSRQNAMILDEEEREPGAYEKMLMDFRKIAYTEISKDTAFFKEYEGTTLRAVPLDLGKEVKVYVYPESLSAEAAAQAGASDDFVPLGGDYLLTYSKKGKNREQLHKNIILLSTRYRGKQYDARKSTYHYHKESVPELITPTDIATLLLYKNRIEWDEHHIISDKYACIFTLVDRKLEIMPAEEYEYIKKKKELLEKEAANANWH